MRCVVCLISIALLAACSSEAPPAAKAATGNSHSSSTSVSTSTGAKASASSATGGGASKVEESSDLYEFDYRYPAEAGRISALRAWLDADRAKARAQLVEDATSGQAEAKQSGFEYHAYAQGRAWEKVAETPRFLSLSLLVSEYTGGAHPNYGFDSLLFDKQAGERIAPLALFTSPAALDAVIQRPFCAMLDKERGKRRGEPVVSDGSMFNDCIKPSEQTVILGSSTGRTFDRIGVLIGPYAAGSYAEGDFDITLPVTAALLRAVRPEYRAAFVVK